jgi:hypothetical protein
MIVAGEVSMNMSTADVRDAARTITIRRALERVSDWHSAMDLLFLEAWEMQPAPGAAAALRIVQIRRANPELAAELRAEVQSAGRRPGAPAGGAAPCTPAKG